ncbi:uncharacterized protein [Watersipora subatra]|uniref:uncharacterized protein isoform X2 n=1 Tax=Watersipora subatra TaxID=2589382 RepID=UPI00355C7F54
MALDLLASKSSLAWLRICELIPFERRLSSNAPQGGAVLFNHRRKQKSFDISMLSRDCEELSYFPRGRSPSPCPIDRTSPNGRVDFCEYVVEEIIVTEQQYLGDLEDIVEGYLDFSKTCLNISPENINDIFSNIEDIYNFHISFLRDLEACEEQPVAIAKCFTSRGTEFDIYAKYVTNYPRSIACLTQLLRETDINDAYRKQQLHLGHGLPLGSYLHKPVQRILKYHLLLQNMLKHFGEDTLGREAISMSLQCMTDCAHNINELKRSHEHAMKIQEIQSMLYNFEGYHLMDFGKLVYEGDLRMHGAKSFRHVYLFAKGVIICKKREDGAMSCKTTIMCHNLMLIESVPREPLSFHLVPYDNPRQQNTFQAKTLEQKREWCSMVKKYILESYDMKIPEKAKELLLALTGKSENDEKVSKHFKAFTLKPHQTPDYIERRRKSQPFVSLSAGGTLPRTKKRVRKLTTDYASSPLLSSLPTTRMSRSMSAPVDPGMFKLSVQTPDLCLPSTSNKSLHAIANHVTNATPEMLGSRFGSITEENLTSQKRSDENFNNVKEEITDCIHEMNPGLDSPNASDLKESLIEVENVANMNVLSSADCSVAKSIEGTSISPLFLTSAVSTPCLVRRHSLSDLKSPAEGTSLQVYEHSGTEKPKSYDELSDRAHLLQRLICETDGFDNPTWSPEVVCMTRRYRTVLVKRTDSYSEAVMQRTTLVPRAGSEMSLSCDSIDHHDVSSRNESDFSDASCHECPDEKGQTTLHTDNQTPKRGRSETSLIRSKLSQLKETASSRISDLLKKTNAKLFKDGEINSNYIDHHEPHSTLSIVGRRLSNSDAGSFDGLSIHRPLSTDQILSNEAKPMETVSKSTEAPKDNAIEPDVQNSMGLTSCESEVTLKAEGLERVDVQPPFSDSEEAIDLDRVRAHSPFNIDEMQKDRDSTISSVDAKDEASEKGSKTTGYSSDNLTDGDYEIVEYRNTLHVENEQSVAVQKANTDNSQEEAVNEIDQSETHPALPPLPEFSMKRRLMKTRSCSDTPPPINPASPATTLHRMSVPNKIEPNARTSNFLILLRKYIETGEVETSVAEKKHHPIAQYETGPKWRGSGMDQNADTESKGQTLSPTLYVPTNHVQRLARQYSTRIKKGERQQKLLGRQDSRGDKSMSSAFAETREKSTARRVSSIRLRRTNSQRIKKFQVMLDSDDEYESKVDSGIQQTDIDSGSDCNDIYEKETMDALESFASNENMRDSAIYSDGEEISECRPLKATVSRAVSFGQGLLERKKRRKRFSRSNSLPNNGLSELSARSVDDLVSRPVSNKLLVRLEALKSSCSFERGSSTDTIRHDSSVQQITESLREQTARTFIRRCSASIVGNETDLVAERQHQLSENCRQLSHQKSTDTLVIDTGLVQNVKRRLQAT